MRYLLDRPNILVVLLLVTIAPAMPRAEAQDETIGFKDHVWPIFLNRCVQCHGPERQRANLRLDTIEGITEGSDFGPVTVPGKPDDSLMFELISLPPDDEDVMPAKGDPLSDAEKETIRKWIEQGASIADWTPDPAEVERVLAARAAAEKPVTILDSLAQGLEPAPQSVIDELTELGAIAMPIDMKSPLLRVNLQFVGEAANDDLLMKLMPLTGHLTWLNLAGTAVTDEGLAALASFPKLTRLHLEKTQVGDEGVAAITNLEHLEYLNLYGTNVTDVGLIHLTKLPNLKKLYLWESQASPKGANALASVNSDLVVNIGAELAKLDPKPEAKAQPLHLLFDEGSCCAKAHAEGGACEHECCAAAAAKGQVCAKCNAGAVDKLVEFF